jgi:selenoprotein W-related protein
MTARPVKVSITYCSECGYQPQTIELAAALLKEFEYGLSSVELIPWHDSMFEVTVGGDLVHSMAREGGFPEPSTIIQAVRERMGDGAPPDPELGAD